MREASAEAVQGGQQFLHPRRVQVGGGLIENQQPGLQGQHRGQGQKLLLAAGQGGRIPVFQPRQPHQTQGLLHPAAELLPGQPQIFRAESHFLVHPGAEKLGLKILEQHPHLGGQLPGAAGLHRLPGHQDLAAKLPPDEPGDKAVEAQGQSGFPGFAGAQDGQPFAFGHLQIQPLKHRFEALFVSEAESDDFDDGSTPAVKIFKIGDCRKTQQNGLVCPCKSAWLPGSGSYGLHHKTTIFPVILRPRRGRRI